MIAWRGVVDGNSHPKLLQQLQADFRHLGNAIIFDIGNNCMNLIYLLPGNLINWLWYFLSAHYVSSPQLYQPDTSLLICMVICLSQI